VVRNRDNDDVKIGIDNALGIHPEALNLRAIRTQALARNIANADTPGYKAQDIDFHAVLKQQTANSAGQGTIAKTDPGHISPSRSFGTGELQYRIPLMPSLDGNSVAVPREFAFPQRQAAGAPDSDQRRIRNMALFDIFDVSGSGMAAQSLRLNTTASNIANAESVSPDPANTYRARYPVFKAALSNELGANGASAAVSVPAIIESHKDLQVRYEPDHPYANDDGYVTYPNVSVVEEMANMISASRSFQMNVEVMNTAKTLAERVLTLGQ
jgi:flagellar basal-body rod protein FlgC